MPTKSRDDHLENYLEKASGRSFIPLTTNLL